MVQESIVCRRAPESEHKEGNVIKTVKVLKVIKDIDRTLTLGNCNPYIKTFKAMEYAARGPVILRAMQIDQELRQVYKYPQKIFLITI